MNRVEQLRRLFDESFREQPTELQARAESRLLLNLGERSLSLPLSQVAEVLRSRTIVPLPGAPTELLGLIGLRGQLLPVYQLADLIGHPAPQTAARLWILVVTQPELVGLAVEAEAASLVASASEDAIELDLHNLVEQIHRRYGHD